MTPLVRKAAAWSWRLLVIFAAIVVLLWTVKRLEVIVVPVALATILAALLLPAVDWLDHRGVPRGAAVALTLLSGLALVGGILTFVVTQFIKGAPDLIEQVSRSVEGVRDWLITGPLELSREQIQSAGDAFVQALRDNEERLARGTVSTATAVTEIVTGAVLVLFTLIFLLHGGRNIFSFVTLIVPATVRNRVRDAGRAGFYSLIGYVRATFLVALINAIGMGTGLELMGIPLAFPLASLVFLGAFVPLVGAVITGFLAVIVALIAKGWIFALITLGLIVAVQQVEGHVLQPLVMGRAVSIHPLAVVLAIASGGVLAGIIGALLAVPVLAFLNSAVRVLVAEDPDAAEAALVASDEPVIKAPADDIDEPADQADTRTGDA
nr:MAG: AI-2E family transporter [Mycolicibacterium hassiacum]